MLWKCNLAFYTLLSVFDGNNLDYDFISRVVVHKQSCKHASEEQDDKTERH